jgi:hypothetical protein
VWALSDDRGKPSHAVAVSTPPPPRFSGTSDKDKCRSVPGYTTAFWAKSRKYSFLSYVLCLKHQ